MSHLIVGDGHYCGAAEEAERWAALLTRAHQAGINELSVLGDFFDLWVGLAGMTLPWQDQLLAPLRQLRERGVKLRYVVGNKDYYVADWNGRHRLFDEVVERSVVVQSEHGLLVLAHGDLANSADRQYRAWRATSRSWPVAQAGRVIPRPWLRWLAGRVATRLDRTNQYHKSNFPEAELRARARELQAGPATLFFGHFHVHRELIEGDKRVITLPFLATENCGILVTAAGMGRFCA